MKKLLIFLLIALMVSSTVMTACGNEQSGTSSEVYASESALSSKVSSDVSEQIPESSEAEDVSSEASSEISAFTSSEEYVSAETSSAMISSNEESSKATSSSVTSSEHGETSSGDDTPGIKSEPYLLNGLIIDGTRVMEQFGGSAAGGAKFATQYMNPFKQSLGDSVNLYVSAYPSAGGLYAPDKYPKSRKAFRDCFTGYAEALADGITYVDVLSAMELHADEGLFFRTDHHWNALGAYYAAQEMAKVMGVPFAELNDDNFVTKSQEKMYGSFYRYTEVNGKKLKMITENPDVLTWYEPKAPYTVTYYNRETFKPSGAKLNTLYAASNGYTKFMSGDSYSAEIVTGCDNGRVIWIIKDSFGDAIPQYFVSSFSKIYVTDIRYAKLNTKNFIAEHGITDVLVGLSGFSLVGANGKYLKNFM